MAWHDDRATGITLTAARTAHTDDAKHRVDETPVRPSRSWRPLVGGGVAVVVVAVVAALLLTRHHDVQPVSAGAASTRSGSASASPTPSPSPSLQQTQPLGRYRTAVRFLVVRPPDADQGDSLKPDVRRFESTGCDGSSCAGSLVGSSGSTYAYTWDGTTLGLSRSPVSATTQCDGGGSYRFTRTYKVVSTSVTSGAAGARPSKIQYVLEERVTYTKPTGGCFLRANTIRFDRRVVTLTPIP